MTDMSEDESTKRVLIPVEVANKILSDGPQPFTWDDQDIVISKEDIPQEDPENCCFRSENMMEYDQKTVCRKCGRSFDVHNQLAEFDTAYTEKVIAQVPHSEFV